MSWWVNKKPWPNLLAENFEKVGHRLWIIVYTTEESQMCFIINNNIINNC